MTYSAALYAFFSGFGVEAYADTAVPDDAVMPYITYPIIKGILGEPVSLTVNFWARTTSEKVLNDMVNKISSSLPKYQPYDGGAILFTHGSPFSQALTDSSDDTVKRRYMNITAENLTLH